MKYELRAIFRSKITFIFIFTTFFLGLVVSINLEAKANKDDNYEKYRKELQLMVAERKADVERANTYLKMDEFSNYEKKYIENSQIANIREVELAELALAELEQQGYKSKEFIKCYNNLYLLLNLVNVQRKFNSKSGNISVDIIFDEEIQKYEEELMLKQRGYKLYLEGNRPNIFLQSGEREQNNREYNFSVQFLKLYLSSMGKGKIINTSTRSPYTYLYAISGMGDIDIAALAISILILFFPVSYLSNCRSNRSIHLVCLKPKKTYMKVIYYYLCVLIALFIILFVSNLLWIIFWGLRGSFTGMTQPIMVNKETYTNFIQGYKHLNDYWYTKGLSRIYADELFATKQGSIMVVTHVFDLIPIWKFLLLLIVLFLAKSSFLCAISVAIGIRCRNSISRLGCSVLVVLLYCLSQIKQWGSNWNIFAIKSTWGATLGNEGLSWITALTVYVLGTAFILIFSIICEYLEDEK